MKIQTEALAGIYIHKLRRLAEVIDFDPPYQREGGVWGAATQSTLIDTVINGLDMPKVYFERLTDGKRSPGGLRYQYAVIDGKQRLEALMRFMRDELALAEDFVFFEDEEVKATGLTWTGLLELHPQLAQRFLDFELPIVSVTTDSGDLIEEMFQRLNASSSLNAAERRNSVAGYARDSAVALAGHRVLVEKSAIRSARYKYRELAAKFLAIEHQMSEKGRVIDTKAATLYNLFVATRTTRATIDEPVIKGFEQSASAVLDLMSTVFVEGDPLLRSVGTVVVYYLVFRESGPVPANTRAALLSFEEARRAASRMNENDDDYKRVANVRLRQYNVYVQSTNDGRALEYRAKVMAEYLRGAANGDALAALDLLLESEPPEEDESEE